MEEVLRLNEQELKLVEVSLNLFKIDVEENIERFKDCGQRTNESVYAGCCEDVLGQVNAMLKRIEEVR